MVKICYIAQLEVVGLLPILGVHPKERRMDLSSEYESTDANKILSYIESGKEENLHLDFKTINNANLNGSDDKKTLSKSISGFANSSGGLIVWGVDARKNQDNIDCASSVKEIENLPLFISRLNELSGNAVSPIVDGIVHKPLFTSSNKGFAVTLIPESDSGPHMAKLGEDRYYKRSGDSFYRMEHFDLEDMFGRRRKAKLELYTRVAKGADETIVFLGLQNLGRGSAVAPYLAYNVPEPYRHRDLGIDGLGGEGLPKLHHAGCHLKYRYGANSGFVIHPGVVHEVSAITHRHSAGEESPKLLTIEFELTAENQRMITDKEEITI
jgi:hypothetical protein